MLFNPTVLFNTIQWAEYIGNQLAKATATMTNDTLALSNSEELTWVTTESLLQPLYELPGYALPLWKDCDQWALSMCWWSGSAFSSMFLLLLVTGQSSLFLGLFLVFKLIISPQYRITQSRYDCLQDFTSVDYRYLDTHETLRIPIMQHSLSKASAGTFHSCWG